jgi:hypothetical protein
MELLRWQLTNTGVGYMPDGDVGYEVEGVRMSGDFNTGLGNIIVMLCLLYLLLDDLDIKKADVINNGDDVAIFLEAGDAAGFRAAMPGFFLSAGFTMKVEPSVHDIRRLEFCQMRPLVIDQRPLMVRNPKRALSRDTVFLHNMRSERIARTIINARGVGGASLYGSVPVLSALYGSMAAVDPGRRANVIDSGANRWWSIPGNRPGHVTSSNRVEFYEAFGIMPDDQVHLESVLARPFPIRPGPLVISPVATDPSVTQPHELSDLLSEV